MKLIAGATPKGLRKRLKQNRACDTDKAIHN